MTSATNIGKSIRTHWPLLVAIFCFGWIFAVFARGQPVRVGDGGEYYALLLAWKDTLRPFMSVAAWASYAEFFAAHPVAFLPSPEGLKGAFPALVSGQTADMNHFWFYSLVPAMLGRIMATAHILLNPHQLFLLSHWVLITIPMISGWKYYRWNGLLTVILLLLLSPLVWFLNKVHTELFTVSLILTAVILFRANQFLTAAFFTALASTQNISFLAITLVVIGLQFFRAGYSQRLSVSQAVLLVATVLLLVVHPAYYFFRLGVLTPQLLAGGAAVGANAKTFYLWFFDPDLGLFPNWPLAAVVLGLALLPAGRRLGTSINNSLPGPVSKAHWIIFVFVYLLSNLFAQSSTVTLNSGATPGISRYALWYVPLFFPAMQVFLAAVFSSLKPFTRKDLPTQYPGMPLLRWRLGGLVLYTALIIGAAAYSYVFFRPSISEFLPPKGAFYPSWSSAFIQTNFPSLYNPPGDVFISRHALTGFDPRVATARAVIGPDCKKVFEQDWQGDLILGGPGCRFVPSIIVDLLNKRASSGAPRHPHYLELTEAESSRARLAMVTGNWYSLAAGSDAIGVLGEGWGRPESWGVWSLLETARLSLPCHDASGAATKTIELKLNAWVLSQTGPLNVRIDGDRFTSTQHFTSTDSASRVVIIPVEGAACTKDSVQLTLHLDRLVSPMDLGLSEDPRYLGVGFSGVRILS